MDSTDTEKTKYNLEALNRSSRVLCVLFLTVSNKNPITTKLKPIMHDAALIFSESKLYAFCFSGKIKRHSHLKYFRTMLPGTKHKQDVKIKHKRTINKADLKLFIRRSNKNLSRSSRTSFKAGDDLIILSHVLLDNVALRDSLLAIKSTIEVNFLFMGFRLRR